MRPGLLPLLIPLLLPAWALPADPSSLPSPYQRILHDGDAKLAAEHGPQVLWLVCSHGDVIKAVLADALGVHLDGFQRIVAHPCSVSAVTYTETRPFVQRVNDCGDDLRSLVPPKRRRRRRPSSDATPGGCTGTS